MRDLFGYPFLDDSMRKDKTSLIRTTSIEFRSKVHLAQYRTSCPEERLYVTWLLPLLYYVILK